MVIMGYYHNRMKLRVFLWKKWTILWIMNWTNWKEYYVNKCEWVCMNDNMQDNWKSINEDW